MIHYMVRLKYNKMFMTIEINLEKTFDLVECVFKFLCSIRLKILMVW